MLVVYSRWVYNFMGIILEAHVSSIFSLLCILKKKRVSDCGDFQTLCVTRDSNWDCTKCKWVWTMNRPIHCKSGSSFMGWQSIQEWAPGMRNVLSFLISYVKSCIHCQTHKGWPRFAMNGTIHRSHSFASNAISITVSYYT